MARRRSRNNHQSKRLLKPNPRKGNWHHLPFHYAVIIMILGVLSVLGGQGFLRFGYAMLLPGMRDALHWTFTQAGLIATANYLGYMVGCLAVGPIVSRWGVRASVTIGLLLTGTSMIMTGFASNFDQVFALQAIAGFGGAACIAPVMGLVTPWFAPARRGLGTGVISAGGPLGSFITGPVVPLFVAMGADGWRISWFVLGVAVLVIGLAAGLFLRNRPVEVGIGPFGDSTVVAATAGQTNAGPRVDWRQVYRIPAVWHMAFLATASTLSAISYNTFFATYLVTERQVSAELAGYLWALVGITGLVGGALWGMASDRIGRIPALVIAYLVTAFSFVLFAGTEFIVLYALSAFMYGLTARANFAIMAALCGDTVGSRLAAAAFGLNSLMAGLGMALGPGVAGYLKDTTGTFTGAFWASAVIATVGAIGTLFLKKPSQQA